MSNSNPSRRADAIVRYNRFCATVLASDPDGTPVFCATRADFDHSDAKSWLWVDSPEAAYCLVAQGWVVVACVDSPRRQAPMDTGWNPDDVGIIGWFYDTGGPPVDGPRVAWKVIGDPAIHIDNVISKIVEG